MTRRTSKRIAFVGAILASLSLLAGCGDRQSQAEGPVAKKVQVSLSDKGIDMPSSVEAGLTSFAVTNTGKQEHSFGIAGPAGDKVLDKTLKPGESGSLELQLDSGTYRVYCPVDQGRGEGTQLALNVVPGTQGGKG